LASRAAARLCTCSTSRQPCALIVSTNGDGSPKERKNARGRYESASATISAVAFQVMSPTPQARSVFSTTSRSSRCIHAGSPYPPPTKPSPPAFDTAAASSPPATTPIGASAIGWLRPNSSVKSFSIMARENPSDVFRWRSPRVYRSTGRFTSCAKRDRPGNSTLVPSRRGTRRAGPPPFKADARCRSRSRAGGHGEIEDRALIDLRLGPDAPAVTRDDALDDGQAHAGAFELLIAVEPLKDPEQFVRVLHVEAGAV